MFVSVPNVNAWIRFLLREKYSWTFHDDHFVHYSTRNLAMLLAKYGFGTIEIYTSRFYDFHDDLAKRSLLFRGINKIIEKMGLGIEIFCLSQQSS